ncbi:MAG: hypothetical protein M3301_00130 [Chloroflexota bacterium]|nr:hypothetical protein [Chloroflexota bacterium]
MTELTDTEGQHNRQRAESSACRLFEPGPTTSRRDMRRRLTPGGRPAYQPGD